MPWNDQSGGGDRGQGPWGGGPRRPWGQPPRPPAPNSTPDLDEMLRKLRERFRFGGGGDGVRSGRGPGGFGWPLIAGVLLVGWLMTGIYSVDEGERAVITTLGKYSHTTGPGLHMHAPPPFQARRVYNVTGQRTADIGFRMDNDVAQDVPTESLMITGDRNIVDVQFRIYYNISDVVKFAFMVREPDAAVRAVAESAMREVIGRGQLEPITTTDRAAVEDGVEQLAQQVLDQYEAGVQVLQVELIRAKAPPVVSEAFNDVIIARSDAETATNNANRETARIVNEAQAYRERVVREATGEAARFIAVHTEYRQSPRVTRDRLYMETMERVYHNGNLIILDQRGGGVTYLPLEGLARRNAPATVQPEQGAR